MRLNKGEIDGVGSRTEAYVKTFEKFKQYQNDVLDIADQAGLLRKGLDPTEALFQVARDNEVGEKLIRVYRDQMNKAGKADDAYVRDENLQKAANAESALRTLLEEGVDGFKDEYELAQMDQKEMWRDQFYVPFYRVAQDENVGGPGVSGGTLKPKEAYKRLKGGKENLNDLLENTLMNFEHLLTNSLRNVATKQAIDNAVELGIAEQTTQKHKSKTATHVFVGGRKQLFNIEDKMVYDSLTILNHTGMNNLFMRGMRSFKRVFTNFTTSSPQFIVANLIRDSLQAVAVADGSDYNVAKNVIKGFKDYGFGVSDKMSATKMKMLASGGAFSFGYVYGRNLDDIKYGIDRQLGTVIRTVKDAKDAKQVIYRGVRRAWDRYQSINDATENVNRAATFNKVKTDSGNDLYAAFQSRDLMDFSAHGSWISVRILTDIVPFLNARIQGLDKIYRSGAKPTGNMLFDMFRKPGEKRTSVTDKQMAGRFAAVTGALLLATLALRAANEDDEEYRKLEEWQKDSYWFFRSGKNAFFIPKPFEVGAIATIGERIFEQAVSDNPEVDGKLFWQRVLHMASDTFSFDPTPQMFNPAIEVWANTDSFTGRPIESTGMQNLSPERRYRDSTSELSKGLSWATSFLGDYNLSPVQYDHLIEGYLSWVGATANGWIDIAVREAQGKESPAKEWYEYQPFRRFYRNLDKPTYTKYGTLFYEYLRKANRVYSDVRQMQKEGLDYQEYLDENKSMLEVRKKINRAQKGLSTINDKMKMVRRSDKSAEEKRQELDLLQTRKNKIQEDIVKMVQKHEINSQ